MTEVISWLEAIVRASPMPLLEVWGRFSYVVGLLLAICAFGSFTFRIGDRWGFGRARQTWNTKAFLSMPLTAVLVIATGYLGSFIVLVEGAQTFESLKDLMVLLCIVLLGYPALIAVPPAYMLSDLIEGVPPGFVLNWAEGYFFWAAFVWMAHQFIGRNPDFRRLRTWARYAAFVALIMLFDPVMWGFICSGKFTSPISYGNIFPALFFTLAITWLLGPVAFLVALPLARRFGWFWAEIPGQVRERAIGDSEWRWEAGVGATPGDAVPVQLGVPIRVFLFTPFIALALAMVGATAIVALQSGEQDAARLATRLHHEGAANIRMQLDDYLAASTSRTDAERADGLGLLLRQQAAGTDGRAFILDRTERDGRLVRARRRRGRAKRRCGAGQARGPSAVPGESEFRFDHVTAKPLSRESWLAYAAPYRDDGATRHWILVTAMPEAFYLADARVGSSRAAMVFAVALVLCPAVGRGAGVDGDRAAPAHRARDPGHGSRRHERAGPGQQPAGARRPRAIVQRNGRPAQVVVRRSGRRSRDAEEARAGAGGERSPPARERRPTAPGGRRLPSSASGTGTWSTTVLCGTTRCTGSMGFARRTSAVPTTRGPAASCRKTSHAPTPRSRPRSTATASSGATSGSGAPTGPSAPFAAWRRSSTAPTAGPCAWLA